MNVNIFEKIEHAKLGEYHQHLALDDLESFKIATVQMARQAKRRIDLFTYDLDSRLFDQTGFLEAAKSVCLNTPDTAIRILLQNSEPVRTQGHRLVNLGRRLTSKIAIRRPHPDYLEHSENFMIVDATGYIKRDLRERYEGEADFHDPNVCKQLSQFFNDVWDKSEPESLLRNLYL